MTHTPKLHINKKSLSSSSFYSQLSLSLICAIIEGISQFAICCLQKDTHTGAYM